MILEEKKMANGEEDLKEKNKTKKQLPKNGTYSNWTRVQGREDAEMLNEKSWGWSAEKSSRGDYDYED